MVAKLICRLIVVVGTLALVACHPIISPTPVASTPEVPTATDVLTPTPENKEDSMNLSQNDAVAAAQADLVTRLDVAADQVKVVDAREVTWPDASLGCPKAGMFYAQIPQKGYLILFSVGKTMYPYHSGIAGKPFLCEENAFSLPTPKVDRFVPSPDGDRELRRGLGKICQ